MICPSCKKSRTKVLDSRNSKSYVRRRRECIKCKYRFTTFERSEPPNIKVLKRNQRKENYCRNKILNGIKLALEKRPFSTGDIEEMVSDIEQKIISLKMKEVPSKKIGDIVINKLKDTDEVAYLRFVSVYKKFGSAKKFQKEVEKLI